MAACLTRSQTAAGIVRPSRFGWFGLTGDETAVESVVFGYASAREARLKLGEPHEPPEEEVPELLRLTADRISAYLEGEPVDLSGIPVRSGRRTTFQTRVEQALRKVGYGETVSYAELADRAGAPRAARAVGTVMSSNRLPLLIPCHRVVGAGGRLGGFSAPRGLEMKRELLEMESVAGLRR